MNHYECCGASIGAEHHYGCINARFKGHQSPEKWAPNPVDKSYTKEEVEEIRRKAFFGGRDVGSIGLLPELKFKTFEEYQKQNPL